MPTEKEFEDYSRKQVAFMMEIAEILKDHPDVEERKFLVDGAGLIFACLKDLSAGASKQVLENYRNNAREFLKLSPIFDEEMKKGSH